MTKLTDESPRLFRPTLAAWIGLNESIFLEQLNFILTEVESKGRFADGKKWYRDTPRAFVITYFPFWDESIVKRTIANLRADALILARSDLNEDPKDRSLWYTINYPRLEGLDGPIDRILGKSEKRKEARAARKSKDDSSDVYTKVQNVLLNNEQDIEPEVQDVPNDESTKCTFDNVQNVLLPQVQNVPTPKESSDKDLKHKDTSPNGEGDKSPPPPVDPIPKIEYTDFQRAFLSRFSAKRFKNTTQHQAVCNLIEQYGESEVSALAEWAAVKGMGLGEAIPAIRSALTNPKRQQTKGANQNGHYNKSTKRTQHATGDVDASTLSRFASKPVVRP